MEEDVEEKAWEILYMFGDVLGILPSGKVTESNDVKNCAIAYCVGIIEYGRGDMTFWRNVKDKIRLL